MYELPSMDKLSYGKQNDEQPQEITNTISVLTDVFRQFDVPCRVTGHVRGPMVTRYEVELGPSVPVRKVEALKDNIALATASSSVRIISPIPGKTAVGVEIPNAVRDLVSLRDTLESDVMGDSPIHVGLGRDIDGNYVSCDIGKLPHVLVAGATGSGKSVWINTVLMSILMRASPDQVRLILVDPKRVELSGYEGIPHLARPVVTDPWEAVNVLRDVTVEMDKRYDMFQQTGYKNITGYNDAIDSGDLNVSRMPFIIVVIDEMSDLMMLAGKDVEASVIRISQLARAAGIHLILATQQPRATVISTMIKANMPSRLAFTVSTVHESRTILDKTGAQHLLGMGDALFDPAGAMSPIRFQSAFVSDDEIASVVEHWRRQVLVSEPEMDVEVEAVAEYRPRHARASTDDTDAPSPVPVPRRRVPPRRPAQKLVITGGLSETRPRNTRPVGATLDLDSDQWKATMHDIAYTLCRWIYTAGYVTVMTLFMLLSAMAGSRTTQGQLQGRYTSPDVPQGGSDRRQRQHMIGRGQGTSEGLHSDLFNDYGPGQ